MNCCGFDCIPADIGDANAQLSRLSFMTSCIGTTIFLTICFVGCLFATFTGTLMMINELEKQKITPTEVRFICKEMKGMSLVYHLITAASEFFEQLLSHSFLSYFKLSAFTTIKLKIMYTRRFQSLIYFHQNITKTHSFLCSLGGISGGTIASVMNVFAEMTMTKAVESADPFFLAPRDKQTNIPIRAAGTSHCTFF